MMRAWFPLACVALIACGGGGGASNDGTDGTETGGDGDGTDVGETGDGDGEGPDVLFNSLIQQLAVVGSDVYLSGAFDNVGGDDSLDYFVKWDGENVVGPGAGAPANVQRLLVHGGDLYTCVGPQGGGGTDHFIARFDGDTWTHLAAFENNNDQLVDCVISPSGEVHMAGSFTLVGAVAHQGVVKWDGNQIVAVGGEVSDVGRLRIADDGTAYLARVGANTEYDDIQRLEADTWQPLPALPGGMTFTTFPWLETVGDELHAAAPVEDASGEDQETDFYSWDGSTWQAHAGDQAFEFDFPHAAYGVVDGEYYASRYDIWAKWSGTTWVEINPEVTFRNTADAWPSQLDIGLAIGGEAGHLHVAGFYP